MESSGYSTLALYRRLFALSGAYRLHIGGVLLLSLLSTPIALLAPLPLKIVVDSVIGSQPLPDWLARVGLAGLLGSQSGALAVAVILLIGVALLNQLQAMSNWVLQTYIGRTILASVSRAAFCARPTPLVHATTTRGVAPTRPTAFSTMRSRFRISRSMASCRS